MILVHVFDTGREVWIDDTVILERTPEGVCWWAMGSNDPIWSLGRPKDSDEAKQCMRLEVERKKSMETISIMEESINGE